MRGTVMSETPADGVKIRLADGTVLTVPPTQVDHVVYDDSKAGTSAEPAAPPANAPSTGPSKPDTSSPITPRRSGRLIITTTAPGKIFIENGERGQAPLDIPSIEEGTHIIRVEFTGGGSTTTRVSVAPDGITRITVEQSEGARAFADRRGAHVVISAEETVDVGKISMIGTRVAPYINLGASPGFDFRVGPQLMMGVGHLEKVDDSKFAWSLAAALQLRFNAGSVYTFWFGGNVGAWSINSAVSGYFGSGTIPTEVHLSPFVTAEVSPLTLRFGEHHEFEVGYTAGLGDIIAPAGGTLVFENFLGVSYLLPAF